MNFNSVHRDNKCSLARRYSNMLFERKSKKFVRLVPRVFCFSQELLPIAAAAGLNSQVYIRDMRLVICNTGTSRCFIDKQNVSLHSCYYPCILHRRVSKSPIFTGGVSICALCVFRNFRRNFDVTHSPRTRKFRRLEYTQAIFLTSRYHNPEDSLKLHASISCFAIVS